MHKLTQALALCIAVAAAQTHARTPLTDAAQALINPAGNLRFTTYGETDLAPVKIFRDAQRTYIQLGRDTGQRVDALEVTPIGYRRLPSSFDAPYLVVGGFVPSLALSYPGRKLVFIEFAPDAIKQPANDAELAIRIRERATALLAEQTRLETARREAETTARVERERAAEAQRQAQQAVASAEQAKREAQAQQASAAAEREAIAKRPPKKAFDVYKADGRLKDVLTRWARNDGIDLEWTAPDDDKHNPQVAADGPVDAGDVREAFTKLLGAFRSTGLSLQANFYNNGIVEITRKAIQ